MFLFFDDSLINIKYIRRIDLTASDTDLDEGDIATYNVEIHMDYAECLTERYDMHDHAKMRFDEIREELT